MIDNAIGKANDLVSGAISVASSKKEFIMKQGINVVLLFIVLAVFGCLDFATLKFHWEYVTTASYWGTVATKTVAGVCSFNIGINLMLDAEIKKNKILSDLIKKYNDLIKRKQVDFEYFVLKVFNREEKRKAYVSWINRKIYRLNKLSRRKDRLLYSSDLPEMQKKKEKNRYCRARKELEELKSDEYIEKNLDSLYVKYQEVDPAVFELEIDCSPSIKGVRTKGSVTTGRVKASSNVVFGMVGFSTFVTAFALKIDETQFVNQMEAFWHYFLKAVEDTFVVLWQMLQGMMKTRKIVTQQMSDPYAGRVKVLMAYLEWRLKNKIPDTESFKELNSEEYLEMTQEEFDKLKSGN